MKREIIETERAPRLPLPFSQAVKLGNLVFVSGQGPIDPKTHEVKGDIKEQTERMLLNIQAILEAAGTSMQNVVNTTLYLTDLKNFEAVNEVYAKFFPKDPPPRATVQAGLLRGMLVEMQCIAWVPEPGREKKEGG
jgi:2-iminobutanoate/2-iminopropanoate deaminase